MKIQAATLSAFGAPADSISVSEHELPEPAPGEVRVHMAAAPINPADINIIEGKYGELPELPAIIGNEGAGFVESTGEGVSGLSAGDLVAVLRRGTWASALNAKTEDLVKLPAGTDPQQASMFAVNPPTALLMLRSFAQLAPGDWVAQNAANSAVGRSAIQIAKILGLRTLNVVRRPELVAELKDLGADAVITEETDLRTEVKTLCGGARPKIALNAVGGASALNLSNALAPGGTLVTYGAMGKQPLKVPNALLIFKDLAFRGFWLTRWKARASATEREAVFAEIAAWQASGALKLAVHSLHPLADLPAALAAAAEGSRNGKVLLYLRG